MYDYIYITPCFKKEDKWIGDEGVIWITWDHNKGTVVQKSFGRFPRESLAAWFARKWLRWKPEPVWYEYEGEG